MKTFITFNYILPLVLTMKIVYTNITTTLFNMID